MEPTWSLLFPAVLALFVVGTLWLHVRDDKRKRERHELDMKVRQDERELLRQRNWSHFTFKVGNREYTVYREES